MDNANGTFDGGENPIANVTLTLTGTDVLGNPVNVSVQTDASGAYVLPDLLPPTGSYTLTVTVAEPTADGRGVAREVSTKLGFQVK